MLSIAKLHHRPLSMKSIIKHHSTETISLLTRHEDNIVIRAGGTIENLREDMVQIISISSIFDKVSSCSRHGVLHFLNLW